MHGNMRLVVTGCHSARRKDSDKIQSSDTNFAQRLRDFRYEITKQNAKFESEYCMLLMYMPPDQ